MTISLKPLYRFFVRYRIGKNNKTIVIRANNKIEAISNLTKTSKDKIDAVNSCRKLDDTAI